MDYLLSAVLGSTVLLVETLAVQGAQLLSSSVPQPDIEDLSNGADVFIEGGERVSANKRHWYPYLSAFFFW